ncbi:MAG TPA: Rdx family protein [Thermoanaerobaculia bacterium]|nr:Rdx family protein [Acidobacteriota bacterium]HNU83451.1 Rdx family protein [Thermoanaerobaculia bacterium]HNZ97601.1 Rdx family protein [Thermoanaerobaculia bacterium]HPA96156.1 Rdx family protein [Thermoanaerobaculia bacterium]HPK65004.1 Rdx family protein [Thermoanaerobaculia bacterium]
MPRAVSLAAEIMRETGLEPQLIGGRNGIFDVRLDGQLVFSRWDSGRHAEPGEVVAALRALLEG